MRPRHRDKLCVSITTRSICQLRVRDIHDATDSRVSADTRGVASRRGIFSTTEPTDDHAVCIFPFRRYEVCGMILYAKSSLELIVNNRIGKVGIRPDGRPPSTPHHQRYHPPLYPRNYPLTVSLPSQRISFSTGVSALQICCPSVRLSLYPSVRPFVPLDCPCVRIYVRTYTYVPARHFRAEYKRVYVYASTYADMYKCAAGTGTYGTTYLRIITYKRVILSYTPALLMIIKTPRSILFALEYFLKFSPDNGAIRVSGPAAPRTTSSPPLPRLCESRKFSTILSCVSKNRNFIYRRATSRLYCCFIDLRKKIHDFVTKKQQL